MKKRRIYERVHKPKKQQFTAHFPATEEMSTAMLPPSFSLLAETIAKEKQEAEQIKKKEKPLDPKTFSHLDERIDEKEGAEEKQEVEKEEGQPEKENEKGPENDKKKDAEKDDPNSQEGETPVLAPGVFSQLKNRIADPDPDAEPEMESEPEMEPEQAQPEIQTGKPDQPGEEEQAGPEDPKREAEALKKEEKDAEEKAAAQQEQPAPSPEPSAAQNQDGPQTAPTPEAPAKEEKGAAETKENAPAKPPVALAPASQLPPVQVQAKEIPEEDPGQGPSLLAALQAQSADKPADAPEDPETPVQRKEDPESETPVDLGAAVGSLHAQGAAAAAGIRNSATQLKAQASQGQQQLKQQIDAQFDQGKTAISQRFSQEKAAIAQTVLQAKTELLAQFSQTRTALQEKGEQAKADLDQQFVDHETAIDEQVQENIDLAEQSKTEAQERYRSGLKAQAQKARQLAAEKSKAFGKDETGQLQRNAVKEVAEKVATEIEATLEENVEALGDVYADIPENFQTLAADAKSDMQPETEKLVEAIDAQVSRGMAALDAQEGKVVEQLDAFQEQALAQLETGEASSQAALDRDRQAAHAACDQAQDRFVQQLDQGANAAAGELEQQQEDAAAYLQESGATHAAGVRSYLAQVTQGFTQVRTETSSRLQQGFQDFQGQQQQMVQKAGAAVQAHTTKLEGQLSGLQSGIAAHINGLATGVAAFLEGQLTGFDEVNAQVQGQLAERLSASRDDLTAKFDEVMSDVQARVDEKIEEGLRTNEEILAKLPGKMDQAARKAKWNHEHPILAGIKKVGGFIAGFVVGLIVGLIKAAFWIVVIALIVAILAIWLPLSTVMLAAAVIGMIAMAVQLIMSYQAQRAEGKSAGEAMLGTFSEFIGFDKLAESWRNPDLSPFEAGMAAGEGTVEVVMNVADMVVPARRGVKNIVKGLRRIKLKGMIRNSIKRVKGSLNKMRNAKVDKTQSKSERFKEGFKTSLDGALENYRPKAKNKPDPKLPNKSEAPAKTEPKTNKKPATEPETHKSTEQSGPKTNEKPVNQTETSKSTEQSKTGPQKEEAAEVDKVWNRYQKDNPTGKFEKADVEAKLKAGEVYNPKTQRFNKPHTKNRTPDIDAKTKSFEQTYEKKDGSQGTLTSKTKKNGEEIAKLSHDDLDPKDKDYLKILDGRRQKIKALKKRIENDFDPQTSPYDSYKDDPYWKKANNLERKISERMGEKATEAAIKTLYPDAKFLPFQFPGKGKQGQFDGVVELGDGRIILLESKGGGGQRGSAEVDVEGRLQRAEQGTFEYQEKLIGNIEAQVINDPNSPLAETYFKINKAKGKGELEYMQVSQRIAQDGNMEPDVSISKFENGKD